MNNPFCYDFYLHLQQVSLRSRAQRISYGSPKRKKRRDHRFEKRSGTNVWIWLLTGMFIGILGAAIIYMMLMGNSTAKKYKQLAETNQSHKTSLTPSTHNPSATGSTNSNSNPISGHSQQAKKTEINPQFEFYNLLPGTEDTTHSATNSVATNPPNAPTPIKNKTAVEKTTPTPATPPRAPVVSLNPNIEPNTMSTTASSSKPPCAISSPLVSSPVVKNQPKLSELNSLKNNIPHNPKNQTKLAAAQYLVQVGLFRKLNQADELKANLALQGFSPFIQRINAQDGAWFRVSIGPFASETKAKQQRLRLDKKHIKGVVVIQGGGIDH